MRREAENAAYRVYVTDALRIVAENTSKYAGGSYIQTRYFDIIHPKPEETRTADEIIEQVLGGLMEVNKSECI